MLRLTETRTGRLEAVGPGAGRVLRIYTCPPRAGRYADLGDLRTGLLTDLIRRASERGSQWVRVVRPVGLPPGSAGPDPGSTGPDPDEAFRRDCAALNLYPAEVRPAATESIGLILDLIGTLVERGHAYVAKDGSVCFDARSFPGYRVVGPGDGHGHGHGPSHGERNRDTEGRTRFPADWVLWERASSTSRAAILDSPWGPGVPGAHLACSAIAVHHLDGEVDVHVGSADQCFPYHEHERAQSDAATGREVVRHWVHAQPVVPAGPSRDGQGDGPDGGPGGPGGAGGPAHLAELAGGGYDPLALRLVFLAHRYREPLTLTWSLVQAAAGTLTRWRSRVAGWAESPSRPMCADYLAQARDAFDDDLDTPAVLAVLGRLEQDREIPDGSKFETFAHLDRLLGLDLARDVGR